jgi:hypothetical protein
MRQFIYCLRFQGETRATDPTGRVLKAAAQAPSCQIRTLIDRHGIESKLEPLPGQDAVFESEVSCDHDGSFLESGTISFGNGHRLHFSTVGRGCLEASADSDLKRGAVVWKVDRGEGQFEGAQGFITSNFLLGKEGEVTDNHFGVLLLQ